MRHKLIIRLIASLAGRLGARLAAEGDARPIDPELLPVDLAMLGPTSLLHDS